MGRSESLSKDMAIDVLKYSNSDDILRDCKKLNEIECFRIYREKPELSLNYNKVIVYVVLLYSRDSYLSQKPIEDLSVRKSKALKDTGFDIENPSVRSLLCELKSEPVVDLVVRYLVYQSNFAWSELIALESQMAESLRLRLRPIDEDNKDKDLIDAFTKKASMTRFSQEWADMLKKMEQEVFADHDDAKVSNARKRVTIESLAR